VFRAFDPERDRLVAVKRIQLDLPPERVHTLVADLERLTEAELTHPSIAAPVAAGMSGNTAYLAVEYVTGDSLDIAIRDYGTAPPADTLRVAAQLASALDFAAVVDVCHGSLHPRDVLLSSDDTRLTGLGIAAAVERVGVAAPIHRPYSAPERVVGLPWDRRADVFSLAAMVFEMLWGKRVPGTADAAVASVSDLPGADMSALRAVFARALDEEPARRFGTALEFAERLRAAFPLVTVAAADRTRGDAAAQPAKPPRVEAPPASLPGEALELPVGKSAARGRVEPDLPLLRMDDAGTGAEPPAAVHAGPPLVPPPAAAAPIPLVADFQPEEPEHHDLDLRSKTPPGPPRIDAPVAPERDRPPVAAFVPPPADASAGNTVEVPHEFLSAAIERSRSAVWPLALALLVGIAIGFAGGYGFGSRERTPATAPAQASAAAPAAVPAPAPAPRDTGDPSGTSRPARPREEPRAADVVKPQAPPTRSAAAPPRPAPFNGGLLVHSTPSGARVFVDGHEYGTTPIPVRELSAGAHRVRIVHEGYATAERRVLLTTSRPTLSVAVELTRTSPGRAATTGAPAAAGARPSTPSTMGRFVGALTIESRPPGAHVYLDGKLVGDTPLQIPDVTAGSHAVRIEHTGYRRWTSAVRVVASETNRVTASLER
jgi:hypothetical protein